MCTPTSGSTSCAPTAALFDVRGRSAEQRIAIDLLADPEIGIVSLGGNAGTGKSVLALAAGLEAVLEQRTHKRVVVFRPLYAVGGQDLGFLPGHARRRRWRRGRRRSTDALESIMGHEVIEEVIDRGLLEVLPLTHIRGRSLTDSFVIIDEAQNLERSVLLTALSRLGRGSRVVLTHDVAQRDNLRVGRHDGVVSVIEALQGPPAVRPRHPHPLRAQRHRRARHRRCSTAPASDPPRRRSGGDQRVWRASPGETSDGVCPRARERRPLYRADSGDLVLNSKRVLGRPGPRPPTARRNWRHRPWWPSNRCTWNRPFGADDWVDRGACKTKTELFFPPRAERPQARVRREAQARLICSACPVLDVCRAFARANREYGFWGGESEEERHLAGFTVAAPIGVRARPQLVR